MMAKYLGNLLRFTILSLLSIARKTFILDSLEQVFARFLDSLYVFITNS